MESKNFDEDDFQLSVEELDGKYNPEGPEGDGEHPVFTRWDWTQIVAQRMTLSGYWKWVFDQLDSAYSSFVRESRETRLSI